MTMQSDDLISPASRPPRATCRLIGCGLLFLGLFLTGGCVEVVDYSNGPTLPTKAAAKDDREPEQATSDVEPAAAADTTNAVDTEWESSDREPPAPRADNGLPKSEGSVAALATGMPPGDAGLHSSETAGTEAAPPAAEPALQFGVVTYNVENLFDVDGEALFDDYKQIDGDDERGYSREKFLTKLETIAEVLAPFNGGAGPEIILFQELEADLTPESTVEDYAAFLEAHADTTARALLTTEWRSFYAGWPASAWLLKALSDRGLTGYDVVTVPSPGIESGIAHTNAVFSKFPITEVRRHPLDNARAIIEATIDVAGHPFVVYSNHWKSGASDPSTELIRVGNARVLRGLIDARLEEDPQADILIGGDLNSHYNHSILFPGMETGINDVLGSAGDESFGQSDLYNLWYELPPGERYAEVWRGRRGTLMHKLVTRGLYDDSGISYVDGSFDKLVLPGLNADAIGRPMDWQSGGAAGMGASDHFPIYAQFSTAPFEATGPLSKGDDAPAEELPLSLLTYTGDIEVTDGSFLNRLDDTELTAYVGDFFRVKARVRSIRPLRLEVDNREWAAYYADPSFVAEDGLPRYLEEENGRVRLIVRPNFFRGRSQLMVEKIVGPW
jgi:endonuclease/exonuclease/phosphatase family metal-dependent hydrolase